MIPRLLFLLILIPTILSCQNSITGEFTPAEDYDFVILYRLTPTGKVYTADTQVDDKGKFKLELESEIKKGNYRLVYNLPEEEHYFDFIYDGNESLDFSFSEANGVNFKSGENKLLLDYVQDMKTIQQNINTELSSENTDKKKVEDLIAQQTKTQNEAETKSKTNYSHFFIKALKPYIPEDFVNKDVYEISRKSDFFDNFDFNDPTLQGSSFPLKMIEDYYHDFVTQKGGLSYRSAINDIHLQLKNTDTQFQKSLMAEFWQKLRNERKNNAANYLAERFLIPLANSLQDQELTQKLEVTTNLTLGAKAPNFTLTDYDDSKTLYEVQGSDYYILAFWSTECSHCLKHMPEIHERLKAIPSGKIKVIAVGMELDEDQWRQEIDKLPDFLHVLAMDDSLGEFARNYDIQATPTFIVVDKDKKIIAKPRGVKNLYSIIDSLENYKTK